MKAEHRKELQTNTLAASMNRLARQIKTTRPQKRTILWGLGIAALVIAVFAFFIVRGNRAAQQAELWAKFDFGSQKSLEELATFQKDTEQGRAALFQFAWVFLWDSGIKQLAANPTEASERIRTAQKLYERLGVECKDDPILGSEAKYNFAVAEESLAVEDLSHLQKAIELYENVNKEYPNTAHAKEAMKRHAALKNPESRVEVTRFYIQIASQTPRFPPQFLNPKGLGTSKKATVLP